MGLLVGMDEAGYGPNFGPLVVSAVAWEVPGDPRKINLWSEFAGVVEQTVPEDGAHIQIADSKEVYSPARGLEQLERGVLSALFVQRRCAALCADNVHRPAVRRNGRGSISSLSCDTLTQPPEVGTTNGNGAAVPAGFRDLCRRVALTLIDHPESEPWFAGEDVPLPAAQPPFVVPPSGDPDGQVVCAEPPDGGTTNTGFRQLADAWLDRCLSKKIRLLAMRSDIVLTQRFNEHTARHNSKGQALSEISMNVLRDVLAEAGECDGPILIHADKHGGRNRYHDFLPIVFDDTFIRSLEESTECSRYRVGQAEIRFETKSERYLPVALASMLSKYLRELSMLLFNRYWRSRLPELKPTAGYPQDARRFRDAIAPLQRSLGIPDLCLWRNR